MAEVPGTLPFSGVPPAPLRRGESGQAVASRRDYNPKVESHTDSLGHLLILLSHPVPAFRPVRKSFIIPPERLNGQFSAQPLPAPEAKSAPNQSCGASPPHRERLSHHGIPSPRACSRLGASSPALDQQPVYSHSGTLLSLHLFLYSLFTISPYWLIYY